MPDPATEARRQRVLAELAKHPERRYYAIVDNPDADPVIVAIAIRNVATLEVEIPKSKWDQFLFLELLDRHCERGVLH